MQISDRTWHPADIIASLKPSSASRLQRVSVLDLCPSTSDYLWSCEPPARSQFNLCVAAAQSTGRGRHGRIWQSNHKGIYLSVAWRTASKTINDGWLLLMTAVRLAENLRRLGISDIAVKWPNDVYYQQAKLAGVLVEQRSSMAVLGIGLNIATPSAAMNDTNPNWIGLEQTGITVPTYPKLIALAADTALAVRDRIGFKEARRRFSEFDMLYNRTIRINKQGKKISAVALGIDEKAHLLVDHKGQIDAYGYGEISLHNDAITDRCRQQLL